MIVKNNTTKMLVLKAVNAAPLRLSPGFNTVDLKNLNVYTKGNAAAQAIVKEHLSVMGAEDLTDDEKLLADEAKKKNDKLNKSAKLLKATQDKLVKAEEKVASGNSEMKEMRKTIKELKKQLAELLKQKPAPPVPPAPEGGK